LQDPRYMAKAPLKLIFLANCAVRICLKDPVSPLLTSHLHHSSDSRRRPRRVTPYSTEVYNQHFSSPITLSFNCSCEAIINNFNICTGFSLVCARDLGMVSFSAQSSGWSAPSSQTFWKALSRLVDSSDIIIDRPRGSAHPRYANDIYPLDYGYLLGTSASDRGGIDVWVGTAEVKHVTAIVATIDLHKRDSEIKILLGCTPEEKQLILERHNQGEQSGILIELKTVASNDTAEESINSP
jgi:inorganic pyrophosphatase